MANCLTFEQVDVRLKRPESAEFHALGKNWALIAADAAPDDDPRHDSAPSPIGRMRVAGRDYYIVAGQACAEEGGEDAHGLPGRIAEDVLAILTPRELQVCELIAAGRCDKQIARSLGISGYTVREYIRRVFAKLQISNRTAVLPRMLGLLSD